MISGGMRRTFPDLTIRRQIGVDGYGSGSFNPQEHVL
jgi:hypothetical protein